MILEGLLFIMRICWVWFGLMGRFLVWVLLGMGLFLLVVLSLLSTGRRFLKLYVGMYRGSFVSCSHGFHGGSLRLVLVVYYLSICSAVCMSYLTILHQPLQVL